MTIPPDLLGAPGAVDTIARNIQLAVAPVFLLTGIGAILNVLTSRLARVVDRARRVEADILASPAPVAPEARRELFVLDRRMAAANWAIVMCTLSALLIAMVVAILFIGDFMPMQWTGVVAAMFIGAMLLLIFGLMLFLFEVQIALRSVRVTAALIEGSRP